MIKTQHCPNCEAQAAEIERLQVEAKAQFDRGYYDGSTHPIVRHDALREENERLRALLARTVNLAEVYAEGTGTNFKEAMAEARAALQGQSK